MLSSHGNRPDLDFSRSVWAVRYLAPIIADILPASKAEEWLGDLEEKCSKRYRDGEAAWSINVTALLRIAQLIWAACQITWSDFINTDWDDQK